MNDTTRDAGKEGLKEFRGPEPDKDGDLAPTPPVADDDTPPVRVAGAEPDKPETPKADADAAPPVKKVNPFDEKRARIAERFSANRDTILNEASDPPPDDGAGGDPPADPKEKTPETPATPGSSDSGDQLKPETMTLVVNGKTVTKTVAEVAALSELSPDEIKADPKRATRYAQLELAKQEGLNEVKQMRRETPSRQTDDTGARPERPAPHQERKPSGDDAPDQQATSRQTSDEDVAKLIEDIQIGDPKEVAPKLKNLLASLTRESASEVVQESEGGRLIQGDRATSTTAVKEFIDDHPEVVGKPLISTAMSAALHEEYRVDLVKALVAEGNGQDEAEQIVREATPEHVRNAHQQRRVGGDPNVRRIDKALIETAYKRVKSEFGIADDAPPPKQQQDLASREQRKQNLPQQPRRASVPPATPPAQTAPLTRKQVVADMASRTGRKRPAPLAR